MYIPKHFIILNEIICLTYNHVIYIGDYFCVACICLPFKYFKVELKQTDHVLKLARNMIYQEDSVETWFCFIKLVYSKQASYSRQ